MWLTSQGSHYSRKPDTVLNVPFKAACFQFTAFPVSWTWSEWCIYICSAFKSLDKFISSEFKLRCFLNAAQSEQSSLTYTVDTVKAMLNMYWLYMIILLLLYIVFIYPIIITVAFVAKLQQLILDTSLGLRLSFGGSGVFWVDVSVREKRSHLNELFFGGELWDQHVLPVTDSREGHAEFPRGADVRVFRQVPLQAGAQHLHQVKGGVQRTQVTLPSLFSHLNHILAALLCSRTPWKWIGYNSFHIENL